MNMFTAEILAGIVTSLIATGIALLASWLWNRRQKRDEILNRLDRLEASQQNLAEQIANVVASVALTNQIMESKFEGLSEKFDTLSAKFEALSASVAGSQKALRALQST